MLADLEQAGVAVTDERPEGAVPLHNLLDGKTEMDAEAHAGCPGHGAWIQPWRDAEPNFHCLDPVAYGHVFAETGTISPPESVAAPAPAGPESTPSADRKIVVEGNKAWGAAGTVRQQWLAEFLARKTPPKHVAATIARFVTEQLVTMPEPLCRALGGARHSRLFESFGNPTPDMVARSTQPGLWMILLAPIATAYEREITGDGERRNTWRENKYSPCTRKDAGAWLRFLAEIGAKHGYEPSPIEQAVAEGNPYRGDNPGEDALDLDGSGDDTVNELKGDHNDDDAPMDADEQEAPQPPEGADTVAESDLAEPQVPHDTDDAAPLSRAQQQASEVADEGPEAEVPTEAA